MVGKKEKQKIISFRLNMEREDERRLYDEIQKHSRDRGSEFHGSSGAYIKKVLMERVATGDAEKERNHLQEVLEVFKQNLLREQEEMIRSLLQEKQGEVLVPEKLVPHTATAISEILAEDSGEDTLPDEAFSYLSTL